MILFTNRRCGRCRKIREVFNLDAIGIEDIVLTDDNADGLAELAWRGLVEKAKLSLPILIDDHENIFLDLDEIIDRIACHARDVLISRFNEMPTVTATVSNGTQVKDVAGPDVPVGSCKDTSCAFT
ncbi:MAG: hypothetical protein ACUVQ6_06395 [Dissulfurimicrobium sp.]|uniref:hypothetical protein n=1 Tax=Dissulfurimicrobium sp. TaxID=2022436 RepID=UPI004049E1B0